MENLMTICKSLSSENGHLLYTENETCNIQKMVVKKFEKSVDFIRSR